MQYCDSSDVYDFGLPAGSVSSPARLVSSVDTSANAITLGDHGLEDDGEVVLRAEAGGTMPDPLIAEITYFAIVLDEHRFSLASSAGGAAVDLTTEGSRLVVVPKLPMAAAISWASRIIDNQLPAHAVPVDENSVPEILRMTAAELAAGKLAKWAGSESKSLSTIVDDAQKRLDRWAKGVPLRGANVPSRTNLAVSATAPYTDARGWSQHGGR